MGERVAKGQSHSDGTYVYTCGHCSRGGYYGTEECSWCYGGDIARIASELKTARGQRYYGLLKSFLKVNGKPIVDMYKALKAANGKLSPVDIAYIALKFDLNYKATWEWLYETRCIWMEYDEVPHSFKVAEAFAAARARYGDVSRPSAPDPLSRPAQAQEAGG